MRTASAAVWVMAVAFVVAGTTPARAQVNMPDPSQISGVPLPTSDVPVGVVSVRVIRGNFANNVVGQDVEFVVDGKTRTLKTDAEGRAEITGLAAGANVRASAVVDGQRLESQPFVVASSGIRVVLVATDPEAAKRAAEDRTLAAGPAVKGVVVLGPETRVVAQLSDEDLNIFYVLEILNTARTPVDIGGPLVFDLPTEARGASVLEGSSKQATASGARVTVTGPFAPGSTTVQVGFGMPHTSGTVEIAQKWPAALQQVTVLVEQAGTLDISSPQVTTKRTVTDQGQTLILGSGPGLAAGQSLVLELSGLPHHALWPRNVALTLAGGLVLVGLWAGFVGTPRRRAA